MSLDMGMILLILTLFTMKHLLGDFVFQTTYMVVGKQKEALGDFFYPLSFHCLVHILLSLPIVFFFLGFQFWWFLPLEFVIHFILDRLKSGPKYGGSFSINEHPRVFWVLFGVDQCLHQLTYILFIFLSSLYF